MTLPNHAVNVMYTGTGIIGSVILIIVAGPYVSIVPYPSNAIIRMATDLIRWLQFCSAQL